MTTHKSLNYQITAQTIRLLCLLTLLYQTSCANNQDSYDKDIDTQLKQKNLSRKPSVLKQNQKPWWYNSICEQGLDPFTEKERVVSIMCYFDDVALVKIGNGARYSVGECFKANQYENTICGYQYSAKIIKMYKGIKPQHIECLLMGEANMDKESSYMSGTYILNIDYNNNHKCITTDIGGYVKANVILQQYADYVAKTLESEKKSK